MDSASDPLDPFSPELALVDPEAAALARRLLPDIVLFEDRPRAQVSPQVRAELPLSRRERRLLVTAAAGVIGTSSLLAITVWSRMSGSSQEPAGAPRSAAPPRPATLAPPVSVAPVSVPFDVHGTLRLPRPLATARRRVHVPPVVAGRFSRPKTRPTAPPRHAVAVPTLMWAPTPGATAYAVTLSQAGSVVFRARTTGHSLDISPPRLTPGTYRWRVFALDATWRPHGRAIVDAKLVLR